MRFPSLSSSLRRNWELRLATTAAFGHAGAKSTASPLCVVGECVVQANSWLAALDGPRNIESPAWGSKAPVYSREKFLEQKKGVGWGYSPVEI